MMKLTKKEITYLADLLPNKSKLSLFNNIKEQPDGTEQKTLTEKGILENGNIKASEKELLDIFAESSYCTRFVLKDSGYFMEKYSYKGQDKNGKETIVLAENDNGEMILQRVESFRDMILTLSELTGMSFVKTSDVEIRFQSEELMVFLAAVDLTRANTLLDYLGKKSQTEFEPDEIAEQLINPQKNSLVQMMSNNYNFTTPEKSELEGILTALAGRKVFDKKQGYCLSGEYETFAVNFLLPQTVLMLEAFQENSEEKLVTAGMLFVSAGLKDIGSFLFSADEVEFSSVTAGHMLKIVENFLTCPDLI